MRSEQLQVKGFKQRTSTRVNVNGTVNLSMDFFFNFYFFFIYLIYYARKIHKRKHMKFSPTNKRV